MQTTFRSCPAYYLHTRLMKFPETQQMTFTIGGRNVKEKSRSKGKKTFLD